MGENTIWAHISAGDIIEGSNGSLWSVKARKADDVTTVVNVMTGKAVTSVPDNKKPVVRITRAHLQPRTAEALVQVQLGGVTLGSQDAQGRWICPVAYNQPGVLLSHLMIWHSTYGSAVSGRNLTDLTAVHAALHSTEEREGYVEHIHTPHHE